jgi:cephalosporin-C deacetylase-like acetyl esterase
VSTSAEITNVKAYWQRMNERAARHAQECELALEPVELGSVTASYATLRLTGLDGEPIECRCVMPCGVAKAPVVLAFHDAMRPVRGWHHLTRYVALGCAVVAMQNRAGVEGVLVPEPAAVGDGWGVVYHLPGEQPPVTGRTLSAATCAALEATYTDAFVVAHALGRIDQLDANRVLTCGDGLGGALALLVASLLPVRAAAAFAPLPSALHESCAQVDVAQIANGLACPALVGMGLLDRQATPEAVRAITSGLSQVRVVSYPRYAHERVNAFEDELMAFLIASQRASVG